MVLSAQGWHVVGVLDTVVDFSKPGHDTWSYWGLQNNTKSNMVFCSLLVHKWMTSFGWHLESWPAAHSPLLHNCLYWLFVEDSLKATILSGLQFSLAPPSLPSSPSFISTAVQLLLEPHLSHLLPSEGPGWQLMSSYSSWVLYVNCFALDFGALPHMMEQGYFI